MFEMSKLKTRKGKQEQTANKEAVQEPVTAATEPVAGQKSLDELVGEFLKKTAAWEYKVKENINSLRNQAASIKEKINEQTRAAIESDLHDQTDEAEKYRLSNRDLRLELEEVEASIAAFENQTVGKVDFSAEIDAIREIARLELEANHEAIKATFEKKADIDLQIKALENQKDHLDTERDRLENFGPTSTLTKILKYIYPAGYRPLPFFEQDNFLKRWIQGSDMSYFKHRDEEQSGPISTIREVFEQSKPVAGVLTARIYSQNCERALQNWKVAHPSATIIGTSPHGAYPGELEITYKDSAQA